MKKCMGKRLPYLAIWRGLAGEKSMVFLIGPRQVGQTTLAQIIAGSFTSNIYFNLDIPANLPAAYRQWSATYSSQLIRGDIRDLTAIRSIGELETLYHLLPMRIGSPLSITSLASDLRVSCNRVRDWLLAFERFFLLFSISPWTRRVSRSIRSSLPQAAGNLRPEGIRSVSDPLADPAASSGECARLDGSKGKENLSMGFPPDRGSGSPVREHGRAGALARGDQLERSGSRFVFPVVC